MQGLQSLGQAGLIVGTELRNFISKLCTNHIYLPFPLCRGGRCFQPDFAKQFRYKQDNSPKPQNVFLTPGFSQPCLSSVSL